MGILGFLGGATLLTAGNGTLLTAGNEWIMPKVSTTLLLNGDC